MYEGSDSDREDQDETWHSVRPFNAPNSLSQGKFTLFMRLI